MEEPRLSGAAVEVDEDDQARGPIITEILNLVPKAMVIARARRALGTVMDGEIRLEPEVGLESNN